MNEVLLVGATGLTGSLALRLLVERAKVHAAGRRAPALEHVSLHAIPLEPESALAGVKLDAYVSCLGTTIRVAGSRAAFIAVDRTLVVRTARIAREHGARQAIVVSSVGADARARNFYLSVKGAMEEDIATLGFERVDFLRPGLLLGERAGRRAAEHLFQKLAPVYNPLLAGPLGRYRAIPAGAVAAAIVALLGRDERGVFVHENAAIEALEA